MQVLFEQLLTEPALQLQPGKTSSFALAAQVRFLVLKNYAAALAEDDHTCEKALQLYVEAATSDPSDAVLWHSMGSLVSLRHMSARLNIALAKLSGTGGHRTYSCQQCLAL